MGDVTMMKRCAEAMRKCATCADCANYNPAPADKARVPFGWCSAFHAFTDAHEGAEDCDELDPLMEYVREWEERWN